MRSGARLATHRVRHTIVRLKAFRLGVLVPAVHEVLEHGYFPRELPPPFKTRSFGALFRPNAPSPPECFTSNGVKKAECGRHTLARGGEAPRFLGLVNPVPYQRLVREMVAKWPRLSRVASDSTLSLSTPVDAPDGRRALEPANTLGALDHPRSVSRFKGQFLLRADVTQFYGSIYSHSVAWAVEGKQKARSGSRSLLGNVLDGLITACQDRQSVGIPIGPDTSLVFGELVMCGIDRRIRGKFRGVAGFRHMDDYELVFPSRSQAEECLALLRAELGDRRLAINPSKTFIAPLPGPFEKPWARDLRQWTFRGPGRTATDLGDYFDLTFTLARDHPTDQVVKYALARLRDLTIEPADAEVFQAFLLQAASGESGVLPFVLEHVLALERGGCPILTDTLAEVLNAIIVRAARRRLDSDVAWALWFLIRINREVSSQAARALNESTDSASLLLCLWLRSIGLMHSRFRVSRFNPLMTRDELWRENWLLVYEANIKGWLPNRGGVDPVGADAHFSYLKQSGVEFLDLTTPMDSPPYTAERAYEPDPLLSLI